jgi:hypothetical protein
LGDAILRPALRTARAAGARWASTDARVWPARTARGVRPGLPLSEQGCVGDCRDDNEEEGETNDEAHALLTCGSGFAVIRPTADPAIRSV